MSDEKKTTLDYDGKHALYVDDDNDTLYYIGDDGERVIIEPGDLPKYAMTDEQREKISELAKSLFTSIFTNEKIVSAIKKARDSVFTEDFIETLQAIRDNLQPVQDLINEIDELKPYLTAELKKDEYDGKTLDYVMHTYTPGELLDLRRDPNSYFAKAIEAAKITKETTERTTAKRADKIEFPLDKPNAHIWNLLNEGSEQLQFDLLPKKAQLEARAMFAINFDELNDVQITRRLQPFDKRVYMAISALFNAGNDIISLSQIYYAMGYTGTPGTSDRKKINDAITKMSGAKILLDNAKEAAALNNIMHFQYDGSLLPIERRTAIINGKLSDAAIKLFREPPLMTFAKQRKQVTTIDVQLLQSPLNKTDANIQIDDYLIERISKAKNGKSHVCTILLKTLYERTNITTKKQRQRATGKIETLLTHYQQQEFIKKYTLDSDKITIQY